MWDNGYFDHLQFSMNSDTFFLYCSISFQIRHLHIQSYIKIWYLKWGILHPSFYILNTASWILHLAYYILYIHYHHSGTAVSPRNEFENLQKHIFLLAKWYHDKKGLHQCGKLQDLGWGWLLWLLRKENKVKSWFTQPLPYPL